MERSHVVKRFRELGWDPVLPDPQDDRNARQLKIQNLREALQLRQNLVDQAISTGGDITAKPPPLPIKRHARMHKLSTDKDSSYQTPPTQKMSALGLGLVGSKPLPPQQLNTDDSGGGTGGSGLVVTTGPKAAALTAQGLLVSGDAKKQPNTDPLSRLLQGNSKGNRTEKQNDGNPPPAPAAAAAPLPLLPPGAGWRQTVPETHEDSSQHPRNPVSRPPQQPRQQGLAALVPSLRRSQRTRGASRLVHSSGASALLTNALPLTNGAGAGATTNTTAADATRENQQDPSIDPIIASPTQSPPIKLTMPRVIVDNSPPNNNEKKSKHNNDRKKGEAAAVMKIKKKRKLDVLKVGEIVLLHDKDDDEEENDESEEEKEAPAPAEVLHTTEEEMMAFPQTRPTPLYERTQAPHGPRSRRPAVPLPLPPLAESIPATPAGLFDISETPEEKRAAVRHLKKSKSNDVTATELALDASNRLLPGVFSPLTEQGLPAIAEAAAVEEGLPPPLPQGEEEQLEKQQQLEDKSAPDSLRNTRALLRFEETEATPAAFNHHLSSAHGAAATGVGGGGGNSSRGRQLRPTSKRLAALLAADMVPETAVDDIYALGGSAPLEGTAPPDTGRVAAVPFTTTTTAKKQSAAPHSALPTLRPFSPRFSVPRSTGGTRIQSILGRLGGGGAGGGGGDITPIPLQPPPQSLLPGSRLTTGPRSSVDVLKQSTFCPLPTAEEPLSIKLRLPLPALAATTSVDGRYMAVLMGSHADWEPCEVLVFAISLERAQKSAATTGNNANPDTLLAPAPVPAASAKVVASISVQRSHYATGLPITPSSLALASTPKGDPILILSGVYDLPDGPASLGRPTIHAVHCSTTGSSNDITAAIAGTALGVESDDPFFSIAMLGPQTLLAVGDGSSGASVIEFDAHFKSYSWGRSLPPAISNNNIATASACIQKNGSSAEGSGGSGGALVLDDVCSLLITPSGNPTSTTTNKNTKKKDKSSVSSPSSSYIITGMSAAGMVGAWSAGSSKTSKSTCIAIGSHAGYAVRAAIPIPHISLTNSNTPNTTTQVQCFVTLLQNRESPIGETAVAVATLSPSGGLLIGEPVPVPAPVTAIGSLAPSIFSSSTPTAPTTTTNNNNENKFIFHHNQDKILLGCGNGTLLVWNLRTGACSSPVDICCGAAITSFATTSTALTSDNGGSREEYQGEEERGIEAVICTSIDGDCLILEAAALMELVSSS